MNYVRQEAGLTQCPSCGSGRLACVLGVAFDVCCECLKVWERLPAGEPYTVDGEQLPFKTPCDNCAFRGKSPERAMKDNWEALMISLANGGEFYCHKGVPLKLEMKDGQVTGLAKEYEYPRLERTADIAGACLPYHGYDRERMRLCRGFLNQFWSK